MWTTTEAPEVIMALGTLLAGSAAIWGAVSAHRGLHSWKTQSVWQQERELSKQLLVALKKREHAIESMRSPFGSMSFEALGDKEKRWEETKADYQRRIEKLNAARQTFYGLSIEAEITWGEGFSNHVSPMISLEADLLVAIEDYLAGLDPDSEMEDIWSSKDERLKERKVVFGRLSSSDEFGAKYQDALIAMQDYLRPKLGLSPQ